MLNEFVQEIRFWDMGFLVFAYKNHQNGDLEGCDFQVLVF